MQVGTFCSSTSIVCPNIIPRNEFVQSENYSRFLLEENMAEYIYIYIYMIFIFHFFSGGGNCPPEGFGIYDGYPPQKKIPQKWPLTIV
jgi:hypothetical protein